MAKWFLVFASGAAIAAPIPMQAQTKAPIAIKAHQIGELQNGIYHHNRTGIEFSVPPDWVIVSQGGADGGGQMVFLRDTISNVIGTAWLKARTIDPADIPALLNRRLDTRIKERNNFEGYKYRSESVRQSTIGGQPALSAVADYLTNGQQMAEYVTWIEGTKSRVLFNSRMPASELPGFQSRFDAIIQSAVAP
jgi:hypothetical protein